MRHILASFLVVSILAVPWFMTHPEKSLYIYSAIDRVEKQIAAAVIAYSPKSILEIREKYFSVNKKRLWNPDPVKKVRILLVPGHEPNYGGAEYGDLKERNMVVDLSKHLRQLLNENGKYEVFVTRDKQEWSPVFAEYFKDNWDEIVEWTKVHKEEVERLERIGEFHPVVPSVIHNVAPKDIALRLFGISKWANENDIDIIIHVHFNDHPGHPRNSPGKYSGFAIYVPENGYINSSTTRTVADSIFNRLEAFNPVSSFPGESMGIVETQDLIAIGAYNSLNAPSLLIEYGYIYEPQFNNSDLYGTAMMDLAFQTYMGLQDFFRDNNPKNMSGVFGTSVLPYTWNSTISEDTKSSSRDIYSLQTAFVADGFYPPEGFSLRDCPRTGVFGKCTKSAIELFQNEKGVKGESGVIGPKTLEELNKAYSIKPI